MADMRTLYEQIILDHNRNPRNTGRIPDADLTLDAFNPLCGDAFTLFVKFSGDVLGEIRFEGIGCALSKASASMLTVLLRGKSGCQAREVCRAFQDMLQTPPDTPVGAEALGMLAAFSGVRDFPLRQKCALLPWRTLAAALDAHK